MVGCASFKGFGMSRKRTSGTQSAVREHQRIAVDLVARCATEAGATLDVVVRDLSLGGAFLESAVILAFGSSVTLTLRAFEGSAVMKLPGVVRWSNASGFGMQFGSLGARETHDLIQVLAQLRRAAAPDNGRASGF